MKILVAFLMLGIFGRLFGAESKGEFVFIDDYLNRWNRFAQGDNSLLPFIRDNKQKFEEMLADAMNRGDKRSVSRVVFYVVVQIGGFIETESPLGKEVAKIFGQLPITKGKNGEKLFFAGDMYFWWKERKSDYPIFPQYEEWEKSDVAQNVAIRAYRGIQANQIKKNDSADPAAQK